MEKLSNEVFKKIIFQEIKILKSGNLNHKDFEKLKFRIEEKRGL